MEVVYGRGNINSRGGGGNLHIIFSVLRFLRLYYGTFARTTMISKANLVRISKDVIKRQDDSKCCVAAMHCIMVI